MMSTLGAIFIQAIELTAFQRFLLMWPLCLAIAVVYKSTRCVSMKQVPSATLILWVTMVFGLYAVGVGLWALCRLLV
ncbi:MAG: hypothetical protein AABZ47_17985 [Planctomycetota bacterium]